ncbi:hypothetical protein L6164_024812 [Bauhinia variegata]|uniref:Uncharacterized protein n=1 Tax=Bauhinia variegata TaxID=167791 RepID=A0ACB9M045_BAUVA|nr:hypothetical protein L6164_024812 [Bauhinia variegata]
MQDGGCSPTMDLLRSEPMQLVQLIIPIESARRAISYLGDLSLFQFKDLNQEKSPFQRTYAAQIKRCGEMARKLRFFREQMTKVGVSPSTRSTRDGAIDLENLENWKLSYLRLTQTMRSCKMLIVSIPSINLFYRRLVSYFSSAKKGAVAHQTEFEVQNTFEGSIEIPLLLEQEMTTDSLKQIRLGYISGLVPREKGMAFERILFRATRG